NPPEPEAETGDGAAAGPGGRGRRGPGAGPTTVRIESGGGRGGRGGRGGGRGMRMQPGQGTFNLSVYHTWRIQDEITIGDGLPVLDLLEGSSVGGQGGRPRHEIQAQAGVFRNGMGMFLNTRWQASTRIDGGPTGEDLFFS